MTTDVKIRKVCPHCYEQYVEEDNYCGNDGARLVIIDFNGPTESRPDASSSRNSVVSGGAEKD